MAQAQQVLRDQPSAQPVDAGDGGVPGVGPAVDEDEGRGVRKAGRAPSVD
ncbi:hypothetical protein [Streptomyces violaceorubidus]|nr:hypothetical protein [Streptomyces violaceorubidus]